MILELKLVVKLKTFLKDVEHMTNNLFVKRISQFQREEQAYFMIQGLQEIIKKFL